MLAPGHINLGEAWAWLICFSVVYCCSELGKNNESNCCLGEVGLHDTFFSPELLSVYVVCILIIFLLLFSLVI